MRHGTEVNPARDRSLREYDPTPVVRSRDAEGNLTRLIERQTARVPSDVFLFVALGAMGAALLLELNGRQSLSRFVGMWPPTLLIMGVYNKLVKTTGPA
jgi:hypothetical protein